MGYCGRVSGVGIHEINDTMLSMKQRNIEQDFSLGGNGLPHYYGDAVRRIFVAIAILIGISIPFILTPFAESAGLLPPLYAGGLIVLLIVLAGLTNPRSSEVLVANAIVSGVGVFLTETAAFALYSVGAYTPFVAIEVIAVLFLIALYLSVKNVRSMMLHTIGKQDKPGELTDTE